MRRLALLLWTGGCATLGGMLERPKVTLRALDVTQVSFDGLSANAVFDVENPNPVALDLARLDYQVTLDGHPLAAGHGERPLSVPSKGTGTLTLPISVRYADLGQAVGALLTRRSVPYTVKATLGFSTPVGVIDIPVETSGEFPLPQPPQPRLVSAQLSDLSLGSATVRVQLAFTNPNPFAVPVAGLSWRAAVEGAEVARGASPAMQLPPDASQPVWLDVRVDLLRAGLAVASALRAGAATVAIDGQLDLGAFQVPIDLRQSVPLR